jgi:hypothetical protein
MHTFNHINHCLIDKRHFSDVIYIMTQRGANIDSDHMPVVIKLRARICRISDTKPQQLRRFAVNRLKDRNVASRYYDELESELQGAQAQPLSWMKNVKNWKKQSREHPQSLSATRENKQIKSGLTRSAQKETRKKTPPESEPSKSKPEEPRMLTN